MKAVCRKSPTFLIAVICSALVISGVLFGTSAAASGNASYYAVYCGNDKTNLALSDNHHYDAVNCGSSSVPGVEANVQSLNSNPKGAHGVTIVEADCFPGTPVGFTSSTGRVSCSEGPDATLTLGSHFAAAKLPTKPAKKKSNAAGKGKNSGKGSQGNNGGKNGKGGKNGSKAGNGKNNGKNKNNNNQSNRGAPIQGMSPVNGGSLPHLDASTDSGGALQTILRIIFGIIGAFALLSITLSGLKYITAAGNPQKTSEAKSGVIYALVGLMLAITAEAIVAFVVNRGSP